MKSHANDRAVDNGSELHSRLRVFILYEDLETGLHAKESLDRFLNDVGFDLECSLDVCRFDVLENRNIQRSATADVVVVTLHTGHDLPPGPRGWLNRWLQAKQDEPSALIFLVCDTTASITRATHWKVDFSNVSTRANVEVFQCNHPLNRTGVDVALDELLYRENSSSEVLDRILHRRDSFLC
jgi:hypothetical protein